MAKKRLKIHNKQGQEEAFDISVENVTLDSEGKTLGTKLAELEHDIEESGDGTYSKPPGGIPASDLAGDIPKDKLSQSVQTSLSKADTALQQETDPTVPAWAKASSPPAQVRSDWNQTNPNVASFIVNKPELAPVATSGDYNDLRNKPAIPEGADLSGLFANVSYNSTLKQISFLDKGNNVVGTLDASPFVRDGMVSGVSLTNGVLTITFNTDSGKTPIEVTLGDLFNTENYYTKTDADGKFVVIVPGKGLSTNDYTDAERTKLQNLPTADGLIQQLNSKANDSEVANIYATKDELNGKQDKLTSSDAIMNINGEDVHYGDTITIEAEDGVGFDSVSTPSTADGTVIITLTNGNSIVLDLKHTHPNKQDVVTKVIRSGTATESLALDPGKFYVFSTPLSSLTVTAFTAPSNGIGVYAGRFTAESSSTSLAWPTGTVLTDTIPSSIEADHEYEFNVIDGVLIMKDVTTLSS